MTWSIVVLALVTLQRLGELVLARRNTRRLLAQGAHEVAPEHYPLIVAMHAAWLAGLKLDQIILDDARGQQNPADLPGRGGAPLSATNPLRAGDQAGSVIGIVDQFVWQSSSDTSSSGSAHPQPAAHETSYRLQPVTQVAEFTGPPRPTPAKSKSCTGGLPPARRAPPKP